MDMRARRRHSWTRTVGNSEEKDAAGRLWTSDRFLLICGLKVRFLRGSPLFFVYYSLTLDGEEGVDLAGGFLLERREDVGIGVQGEADLRVP